MRAFLRQIFALSAALLVFWVAMSDSVQAIGRESEHLQADRHCAQRCFDLPSERLLERVEENEGASRPTSVLECSGLLLQVATVSLDAQGVSVLTRKDARDACTLALSVGAQNIALRATPPPHLAF